MKKSRFTESQIVAILKEGVSGIAVTKVLRNHDDIGGVLITRNQLG